MAASVAHIGGGGDPVITIEYDEMDDTYYGGCHACGWTGPGFMYQRNASLDADRHDGLHDDGVIGS